MGLLKCIVYLAVTGIAVFIFGRLIPYDQICEEKPPFRSEPWEQDGRLYDKLGIRRWQGLLPDMSRILPGVMPAKSLGTVSEDSLRTMIKETCIAELCHDILGLTGLYCLILWPAPGGCLLTLLYCLTNVPFILVQRWNRPRLLRLARRTGVTAE